MKLIVAVAGPDWTIGDKGSIPWTDKEDMARFKKLTMGGTLVMGRKTYESIGRPLPGRRTVVLSRDLDLEIEGVYILNTLEKAAKLEKLEKFGEEVWLCGGASVYQFGLYLVDEIHISFIPGNIKGDTVFPKQELLENWDNHWKVENVEICENHIYQVWKRVEERS